MQPQESLRIAIIGAREASQAGLDFAYEVGMLLAEADAIVYTGGGMGIMEAASRGVHTAGGIAVGILKGDNLEEANEYVNVPIMTGVGDLRNGIIIRSAHGVIAVEGAYGTLTEIGFTLSNKKPVVGYKSWDIPGLMNVSTPEEAIESLFAQIKANS